MLLDLLSGGGGHLRATADAAQLVVDHAVGLAGAPRPGGHEAGELLAGGGAPPGVVDAGIRLPLGRCGLLLLGGDLLVLALAQQGGDLLGLQEAGQPQVVLLLYTAHHGAGAELAAVEQDAVELTTDRKSVV